MFIGINLIDYYIEIEEEMKKSFSSMITNSINIFPSLPIEEWMFTSPNQIVLASLHMIVSHELYEMFKICQNATQNLENESNQNEDEEGSVVAPPNIKVDTTLLEEKQMVLNKNTHENSFYGLKKREEIVDMFGRNFDNNILGRNKEENLEILQQKSFRGLILRLQFWVNQMLNFLKGERVNQGNSKKIKDVENVLTFIFHLRECVLEMYSKIGKDKVDDFEFKKHLKIMMEPDTNNLIAECGG